VTRYATQERTFDCMKCDTRFTWREAIEQSDHFGNNKLVTCPCCHNDLGWISYMALVDDGSIDSDETKQLKQSNG